MALDYLLEIDGIDGDSDRHGHEGAIEVLSWSWGVSQTRPPGGGGGGGGGAGRPQFDELQVVTFVGRASPELVESCATGRRHRSAVLVGVRDGEHAGLEVLRYELSDVTVNNVEHSDGDDGVPVEELALDYRSFSITVTEQRPDGSAGRQLGYTHR